MAAPTTMLNICVFRLTDTASRSLRYHNLQFGEVRHMGRTLCDTQSAQEWSFRNNLCPTLTTYYLKGTVKNYSPFDVCLFKRSKLPSLVCHKILWICGIGSDCGLSFKLKEPEYESVTLCAVIGCNVLCILDEPSAISVSGS